MTNRIYRIVCVTMAWLSRYYDQQRIEVCISYTGRTQIKATPYLTGGKQTCKNGDVGYHRLTGYIQGLDTHTITFNNGKEFAKHEQMESTLECETYFDKPYHSWGRGQNENANGLLHQ